MYKFKFTLLLASMSLVVHGCTKMPEYPSVSEKCVALQQSAMTSVEAVGNYSLTWTLKDGEDSYTAKINQYKNIVGSSDDYWCIFRKFKNDDHLMSSVEMMIRKSANTDMNYNNCKIEKLCILDDNSVYQVMVVIKLDDDNGSTRLTDEWINK